MKKTAFLLSSILLLFGCESPLGYQPADEVDAALTFNMRLPEDSNGYYHLTINPNTWQTTHRVSGEITADDYPVENFRIGWESSHYWYLGDTLGYIVNRTLNYEGQYVSIDTSYMVGFGGQEVPTTNQVSLSNGSGEFNNMIAPVRIMIGDTLVLTAKWFEGKTRFSIVLD